MNNRVRGLTQSSAMVDEVWGDPILCANCRHDSDAHMPDGRCLFGPASWEPLPPRMLPKFDFDDFSLVTVPAAVSSELRARQGVQAMKQQHNARTTQVLRGRR